jgi:hypothetical protein
MNPPSSPKNAEVPEAQQAWFDSLPEEAQKAARRAELDKTLPVLVLIMQEIGVPGICACAAYLDVLESGSVDPFDMPEIIGAALPAIEQAVEERVRERLHRAMSIEKGDDPKILEAAHASVSWNGTPHLDELQHAIGTFIDAALNHPQDREEGQ